MFKSRPRKYVVFCIMFNNLNPSSHSTLGHYCVQIAAELQRDENHRKTEPPPFLPVMVQKGLGHVAGANCAYRNEHH
jgi:hypothetical protein